MADENLPAVKQSNIPAYMERKTARLGNLDRSDMIIPRIKLIQAISPEVTVFDDAKPGTFWHTTAAESMGSDLKFVPLVIRKSYVLWAPRGSGDDKTPLARAKDGIHWDVIDTFEVKPKGSSKKVKWTTAKTVGESGLAEFGSSIPDDPKSLPAATLTYEMLAYFPDFPEYSPAIILMARSAVKKAKLLISRIDLKPVDHYGQLYIMTTTQEQGSEGPYFNYAFASAGYADEDLYLAMQDMYKSFEGGDFRASDESDETGPSDMAGASQGGKVPF